MTKTINLKALRPRLPEIIDEIDSKMDRFVITKHGRPVALMMSIDDYEGFLETLNILNDKKLSSKIRKAEAELRKGDFRLLSSIEKDLGLV